MSQPRNVVDCARLQLRELVLEDAPFILQLLNEDGFRRFIGDKGVRTLADAREYLQKGPIDSYRRYGFGLYLTSLRDNGVPIGICGLLKRETLDDVDVGFAFLSRYWSKGYAAEAAAAVLAYGRDILGIKRIVAITAPENHGSIAVLEKIGLRLERQIKLDGDAGELNLFGPAPQFATPAVGRWFNTLLNSSVPGEFMHPFPHRYAVHAAVRPDGDVPLSVEGLRVIESAPPKEFDGPGNQWSPEGLLTAAVADCFVLGFRAIAAASKFAWTSLEARTEGTLDRVEGKMRFTQFDTHAKLQIPAGGDIERAKRLLEKAEASCLVANSLSSERHLTLEVGAG